ncbi:MobQ family relaxase [Pleomorphomonas koreensis]|uniref:MobQ family relaxase n=1 Tax=Pleomorphomonas koreensis TaxID=257440 RepID=UPI000A071FF2|nr:MobQ family relaxase [Pleomorphomonas koreensis]
MALYHLHVKNISRADGRTIVAAAAYRAGETLPNEAEERLSAFGGRRDVLCSEILLPAGAPAWMRDRATLWNAVEASEKRKDARLAKEIEIALPRELPREAWLRVARQMASLYVSRGHVVDLALHDDGSGHNPHAHLLMSTRAVTASGFGLKIRSADEFSFVKEARASWASIANEALAAAGISAAIDPRSNRARNIEAEPTRHRGANPEERRARRRQRSVSMEETDRSRLRPGEAAGYVYVVSAWKGRYGDIPWRLWPPANREPPADLPEIAQAAWTRFWADVDDQSGMRNEAPSAEAANFNPFVLHEMRDMISPGEIRQKIEEALQGELFPYLQGSPYLINSALALADHDEASALELYRRALDNAQEQYRKDNDPQEPLPWLTDEEAIRASQLSDWEPDEPLSAGGGPSQEDWWRERAAEEEPQLRDRDEREPER